MKKEVICLLTVFLFLLSFQIVFSSVRFSDTDILLQDTNHAEINIDLSNEKNESVVYSVVILCDNCIILENQTSNVLIKTFNNSFFAPKEKKTAILKIDSLGEISNPYYYHVLVFENDILIKNQSLTVRGFGKPISNNVDSNTKKSSFDLFSIRNPFILFLFLFVFCYFGLKLFLKTAGNKISTEMFFLITIISSIVLTLAIYQVFLR